MAEYQSFEPNAYGEWFKIMTLRVKLFSPNA